MKRSNLLWCLLLMLACLFTLPALALAENPEPSALGLAAARLLAETVFPIIAAAVAGFAVIVLRKLATKFNMEGLLAHEEHLRQLAYQAVALAEERAAKLVKAKVGAKPDGNQKLQEAIAYVLNAAPTVSKEQAAALVESTLARLPSVGATGPVAVR